MRDTGLGNVADKIAKNQRKTIGLLRDLQRREVGGRDRRGSRARASSRSRGRSAWSRAITPSTNPGATPANNIINALKGRNAIIARAVAQGLVAPLALLLDYMHAELDRVGAPRDLVQVLPAPVTREQTLELMRQADLVVATGSQTNVRAAYASGTPALGVGAGNVAVDRRRDGRRRRRGRAKIARSKTFDNATSCSSENSRDRRSMRSHDALLAALAARGRRAARRAEETRALERRMFAGGKLSPAVIAQSAAGDRGARRARAARARATRAS